MQSNSPFSTPPPIPTPDGNFSPVQQNNNAVRDEWKDAPAIVKGWAYVLTWLNIVVLPLAFLRIVSLFISRPFLALKAQNQFFGLYNAADFLGFWYKLILLCLVSLFAMNVWLNLAFKNSTFAAWETQILLSILGLFAFPIGTIIYAYILSQWFKPETKAWFGKN